MKFCMGTNNTEIHIKKKKWPSQSGIYDLFITALKSPTVLSASRLTVATKLTTPPPPTRTTSTSRWTGWCWARVKLQIVNSLFHPSSKQLQTMHLPWLRHRSRRPLHPLLNSFRPRRQQWFSNRPYFCHRLLRRGGAE